MKKAFDREIALGLEKYNLGSFDEAFYHFERAHVLGQNEVWPHTLSHLWMLKVGIKTKNLKEVLGQLLRIPLGVLGSSIGIVPTGNTGGANVSAFKKMPIPEDLLRELDSNS